VPISAQLSAEFALARLARIDFTKHSSSYDLEWPLLCCVLMDGERGRSLPGPARARMT